MSPIRFGHDYRFNRNTYHTINLEIEILEFIIFWLCFSKLDSYLGIGFFGLWVEVWW